MKNLVYHAFQRNRGIEDMSFWNALFGAVHPRQELPVSRLSTPFSGIGRKPLINPSVESDQVGLENENVVKEGDEL